MHRSNPRLYRTLGIYLPLITTNCAVLGVALLNVQARHTLFEAVLYGFGAAVGFGLVLILFSPIRDSLEIADVPERSEERRVGREFVSTCRLGCAPYH